MNYVIVEFKGDETDWVVANDFSEALQHAKDDIDDMAEDLEAGNRVARQLAAEEVAELEVRIEDAGFEGDDKYQKATEYIQNEISMGQVLPFHLMATYF